MILLVENTSPEKGSGHHGEFPVFLQVRWPHQSRASVRLLLLPPAWEATHCVLQSRTLGRVQEATSNPWESKAKPGCRPSLPTADVPAAGPGGLPVSSESGSAGSDDGEALLSIRATAGLSFDQDPPPGSLPDRQPPRCEPQPGFSVSVLLPRASDPGNLPPLGTSTSALDIWADPGIWGNLTLRTE